jgi:uncharacterized protein involved in exopolysaccharide biosynthesis
VTSAAAPTDAQTASPNWILALVLGRRHRIVGWALLAGVVISVTVLALPRTYTSTASVLPVVRRSGGNLAGLAASLGFNLSGVDLNQSPSFYADLATAPTILIPVVNHAFDSADTTAPGGTLKDYYRIRQGSEALRTELAVKALQDDLHVTLKARTGVVQIDVTLKNPQLARAVVLQVLAELTRYNIGSRQSQASAERRFTEQRAAEARDELMSSEDRLRHFLRANRTVRGSPDLEFEQSRLERDVTLRQQIYTTLAEAYEQARIEEVRDTPLLTIVEPPRAPAKPDGRAVILKVLIAMFVGGGVALLAVLAAATLAPAPLAERDAGGDALRREWAAARDELRHPIRTMRHLLGMAKR